MVIIMTMIMVNIHEAKAKLSEYVDAAVRGERVVICRRNRPVVELRASPASRQEPRPIGLDRGRLEVPPSFFEPLPEDVVGDWEGQTADRAWRASRQPARKPRRPHESARSRRER
jgi:antitoxin (DNA-binding transcriptional repressor) of toxin-antitoxin stability system